MEFIYDISLNIIVIGGAISIILLFAVLVKMLIILTKINNFLKEIREGYNSVRSIFYMPLYYLKKILYDYKEK